MGLLENPTNHGEKQAAGRRKRACGPPRTRQCLLKGCKQRFRPKHGRQRYCCRECRQKAREWSRWRAQRQYRGTKPGKEKRNGQSRRYRQLVRQRQTPASEAVPDDARVITKKFFRCLLRPPWLLRRVRAPVAVAATTLLLARLPACLGTRFGARTAPPANTRRLSGDSPEPRRQLILTY